MAGAASEFALFEAFGNAVTTADFGGSTTTGRPFGFVGSEQYGTDAESGLLLLGNRYYDPSIGRFLSSDPAHAGSNWYAYCENNPVNAIDPTGLDFIVGGNSSFQDEVNTALRVLPLSPRAKEIIDKIKAPDGPNVVILPKRGKDPGEDDRVDPDPLLTILFGKETWVMTINDRVLPIIQVSDGKGGRKKQPVGIKRIIAHELGHVDGTLDDGPDMMNNVNKNENPIMRHFGEPDRLKYR